MDLTSLINTIITSVAALVAIIGGLLVSRVISLANDQHFIKRQLGDINLKIKHKEQLHRKIEEYLFEDDLDDFVTIKNLKLLLQGRSLKEIVKESEYDYLTIEELLPHFEVLLLIKDEVIELFQDENFSSEWFAERLDMKNVIYSNRIEWYERMLEALIQFYTPKDPFSFNFPYQSSFPTLSGVSDYKQKVKEKEQLENELIILKSQKQELVSSVNEYFQIKGIWVGIGVLAFVSFLGILYPASLLPYNLEAYNDLKTKNLLIAIFAVCLVTIFGYLIIYLSAIIKQKNKVNLNEITEDNI